MSTSKYAIAGMTCGHCELSVREKVCAIADVHTAEVSAETGTLVVTSSGPSDDAESLSAVEEAGYSAVPAA